VRRLRVEFQPEARADLVDIFRVVLRFSESNVIAERFVARIIDRCERIGNVPLGGRPRDDLQPGLRTVPFERSAVIAYAVDADRVRITNVFYGGRDYEVLYRGHQPQDE